jgi:hypothetical protein
MAQNMMELFSTEAPEVAAAFNNLIMTLVKRPALDAKTRQLIYITMKAAMGDRYGSKSPYPHGKGRRGNPGRGDRRDPHDPDGCRDPGDCSLPAGRGGAV